MRDDRSNERCTQCGILLFLRAKYWFNPFIGGHYQCDRIWCRLWSGHLAWAFRSWRYKVADRMWAILRELSA